MQTAGRVSYNANVYNKCRKYLEGMTCINKKTVTKTPGEVREFIREYAPKRLQELARLNCFCAKKIKTKLDTDYGRDNYVMIAIGRSIASVAELIEKMGAQVKIIPLSSLRTVDNLDDCINKSGKEIYKEFLESIGLSGDILRNTPEKEYILMDYTKYGRSLSNAEELLRDIFGEVPNLKTMSLEKAMGEDYINKYISFMFSFSRLKDFSPVGRLPIKEIENVYRQASECTAKEYRGSFTQNVRRLFRFLTLDSLIKEDYDAIPCNEIRVIVDRIFTPETLRRRIKRLNDDWAKNIF